MAAAEALNNAAVRESAVMQGCPEVAAAVSAHIILMKKLSGQRVLEGMATQQAADNRSP
jgi:hypothetical protein